MSLPRIDESEPWQEEDDEFPSKIPQRLKPKEHSFTTSISSVAKIGIYVYLSIKLISRSSIAQDLVARALKLTTHNKSISCLFLLLLGALFSFVGKTQKISPKRSRPHNF